METKYFIRLSTLLVILLFGSESVYSQKVSGGISGGAVFQKMELKSIDANTADIDNVIGTELGIHMLVDFGGVYIRPTALAGYARGKAVSTNDEAEKTESTFKLTTLETPVMVGLRLLPILSVEAGPSYNYIINYSDNVNGVSIDLNRHYLGYRAGVQVNISRLGIFGHYGGIINNASDSDYQIERPARIIVGLNLNLGSQK